MCLYNSKTDNIKSRDFNSKKRNIEGKERSYTIEKGNVTFCRTYMYITEDITGIDYQDGKDNRVLDKDK